MTDRRVQLQLQVNTDSPEDVLKATEVLTRAATGLALEGLYCEITLIPYPIEEEAETSSEQ